MTLAMKDGYTTGRVWAWDSAEPSGSATSSSRIDVGEGQG